VYGTPFAKPPADEYADAATLLMPFCPAPQDLVTYRDFFNQFGKRTPSVLLDELTNLGNRLHFAVTKVRGGHG
jgi:hypothetical protein